MSVRRFTLAHPHFAERTGAGVRVAVIDSGVHAGHPHVGGVEESACIVAMEGGAQPDAVDRLGHGTAVAAAIREKAPGAHLIVGKIFDRELATNAELLARGVSWAVERQARIINLSLGTANQERATLLSESVATARARGAIAVSARASGGTSWLPGSLSGAASVLADAALERDELTIEVDESGALIFRASPYPRPIPGVPRERNLSGVSFAVANVSGFLARLLEDRGDVRTVEDVARLLSGGRISSQPGRALNYEATN